MISFVEIPVSRGSVYQGGQPVVRLFDLKYGEVQELLRILNEHFSGEDLRRILRDPSLMERMVKALSLDAAKAVNPFGIWIPAGEVLTTENERLESMEIAPDRFEWQSDCAPPERTLDLGDDEVWVLETSLASLADTVTFYVEWMAETVGKPPSKHALLVDQEHLQLIPGQVFQPMTRRWRRLQLNAYHDHTSQAICHRESPELIAAVDVFAAFAQNPSRFKKTQINGKWGCVRIAGIAYFDPGWGGLEKRSLTISSPFSLGGWLDSWSFSDWYGDFDSPMRK